LKRSIISKIWTQESSNCTTEKSIFCK